MKKLSRKKVKRFEELLSPSALFVEEDGPILEEISRQYPYLNEAVLLHSAWKKHFDKEAHEAYLGRASLFAGNRLLFNILLEDRKAAPRDTRKDQKPERQGYERPAEAKKEERKVQDNEVKEKPTERPKDIAQKEKKPTKPEAAGPKGKDSLDEQKRKEELEAQIQARLDAIRMKGSNQEKFNDTDHSGDKGELNDPSGTDPERSEGTKKEKENVSLPEVDEVNRRRENDPLDLIDRFLKEEPRIKPVKDYEGDAELDPEKSIVDEGGVVSETLARIHAKQGNYKKAIEIYNKLSLKFPGKSSYFAARIKELQEKQSNK